MSSNVLFLMVTMDKAVQTAHEIDITVTPRETMDVYVWYVSDVDSKK